MRSGYILLTVAAIKLAAINGYGWSSYAHDMDVFAYGLDFHDMIANPNLYGTKTYAFPVRAHGQRPSIARDTPILN